MINVDEHLSECPHCAQTPRRHRRILIDGLKADQMLSPGEVAAIFAVDPKTVTRWAQTGQLRSIRTPGGHRRYRLSDVTAIFDSGDQES